MNSIEDLVLDHLTIPESALVLYKERIDPSLLIDTDGGITAALEFVFKYIDRHGEPPPQEIFSVETGYDEFETPTAPIGYVIEKLRERHQRRELKSITKKLARLSGDPAEALEWGFNELARVKTETQSRLGISDTWEMHNVITRYETRQTLGKGVTFGFDTVDASLAGLQEEALYFILGRPKRYKSWFLIKSACEALLEQEYSTVFFTLEMSDREMQDRLACMVAKVSWDRFVHKCLSDKEMEMLQAAADTLRSLPHKVHFIHPDLNDRTVPAMVQTAKQYDDIKAVYIDQLSFIRPTAPLPGAQQWREIQDTCRELKYACANWPVYVAAQFNREAASMNEMADLAKIGLSDAIGQTADMLLGLYANKEMQGMRMVQFGTVDSRSFGMARWDVKVDLTLNSNFHVANRSEE